ncbi:hypothetical protein Tco_0221600 [Tanacetum coccineum]
MACTERGMSWCRLARTLVTSTIDQVALLEAALHLLMEERSSYSKIEEVRMKSSKCEGGCFMVIQGNAKEYQIRNPKSLTTTNSDYADQWVVPSATKHNRGALSWYKLSAMCHTKDCGPSRGLYLCQIVLRYPCARTELITPDVTYPSTYQLLRSSGGDSGPNLSFEKSASPKRLFSLARVSLAEASKPDLSSEWSGGDYTSSCPPSLVSAKLA